MFGSATSAAPLPVLYTGWVFPALGTLEMKISLPDVEAVRVLVAAHRMLDRFWHGATDRISPEAPARSD